jgi:hypothetical protein
MCLLINEGKHPEGNPIILEDDLKVFKILRVTEDEILESIHQNHQKWTIGEIVEVSDFRVKTIKLDDYLMIGEVYEGLHSFISPKAMKLEVLNEWSVLKYKMYKYYNALIPKGILVYYGLDMDIVSLKLKIISEYV